MAFPTDGGIRASDSRSKETLHLPLYVQYFFDTALEETFPCDSNIQSDKLQEIYCIKAAKSFKPKIIHPYVF